MKTLVALILASMLLSFGALANEYRSLFRSTDTYKPIYPSYTQPSLERQQRLQFLDISPLYDSRQGIGSIHHYDTNTGQRQFIYNNSTRSRQHLNCITVGNITRC